MPTATTELNLQLALDSDDDADYLTISLANSLRNIDALFNNVNGHNHSGAHQGGPIGTGSVTTAMLADGSVTSVKIADGSIGTLDIADGAVTSAKLAAGSLLPENLFANTWTSQGTAYTVAATVLWVFCTAAITVTFPAAASTNRPITVVAVTGQSTCAGGTFVGGSLNTSTGAVQNGIVAQGDAITYKSDGTT